MMLVLFSLCIFNLFELAFAQGMQLNNIIISFSLN